MINYPVTGTHGRTRRVIGHIRSRQQQLSDRAHAAGDAYAVAHGWTIAHGKGPLGMGDRTYRDPRFGARA
jgi:hypothetical protein